MAAILFGSASHLVLSLAGAEVGAAFWTGRNGNDPRHQLILMALIFYEAGDQSFENDVSALAKSLQQKPNNFPTFSFLILIKIKTWPLKVCTTADVVCVYRSLFVSS